MKRKRLKFLFLFFLKMTEGTYFGFMKTSITGRALAFLAFPEQGKKRSLPTKLTYYR